MPELTSGRKDLIQSNFQIVLVRNLCVQLVKRTQTCRIGCAPRLDLPRDFARQDEVAPVSSAKRES